jgi:hypothetical protein
MARKKSYSEEDLKNIKLLRSQNEIYIKTMEQAKVLGNEQSLNQIKTAQREMAAKADMYDEGLTSELIKDFDEKTSNSQENIIKPNRNDDDVFQQLEKIESKKRVNITKPSEVQVPTFVEEEVEKETPKISTETPQFEEMNIGTIDNASTTSNVQYDVIPLPSNGECYPSKIDRIPVSYLTAYDENFIMSPNLYRDGLVIDYLLKNKVLTNDIDVDDLVSGDADAVILFLRATSYGVEFPISVTDPTTGEEIQTNIDLTTIKTKEFKLKGDKDGYFSYELPLSKSLVKFKYLTRKEERQLLELSKYESDASRAVNIRSIKESIKMALRNDTTLDSAEKQTLYNLTKNLEEWANKLDGSENVVVSRFVTNMMEMQITSIDGNKDRKFIHDFVNRMPAQDSLKLRRYILENKPGMDFEIEIERPESLGGGSFKTFLEWDDNVFLNIA